MARVKCCYASFFVMFILVLNSALYAENFKWRALQEAKQNKKSEYSAIICFHLIVDDNRTNGGTNQKINDNPGGNDIYTLSYSHGTEVYLETVKVKCKVQNQEIFTDQYVYFAARPGNYNLLSIGTSAHDNQGAKIYDTDINGNITLEAGKVNFLGDLNVSMTWKGMILNSSSNVSFRDSLMDVLRNNMQSDYPLIFDIYKNDLITVSFNPLKPLTPVKTDFVDTFSNKVWAQVTDSTQNSFFDNGHLTIESKSGSTPAAQWTELPESLPKSFEIELKTTWKAGSSGAYGLMIGDNKQNNNYLFGISANGNAGIWFWYAGYTLAKSNKRLIGNLFPWKNIEAMSKNGKEINSIKVQVSDGMIMFYVNDSFVCKGPVNKYYIDSGNHSHFLFTGCRSLGVFSFGKQTVEFNEIRFSKL